MSDRPLDQIKRDTLRAERAAHLRKQNLVGADPIDALDNVGIGRAYHHDGPYDATLFQRNKDKRYAPVEAVRESNAEALKATPREHIQDSLTKHVPLTGTADFAPGQDDINGRRLSYEEGSDLMRDPDAPGGPYSRYEGIVSYESDPMRRIQDSCLPSGIKSAYEPALT
ncbi:uncharacterized protein BCR38DRAFT_147567 [Pseudomassariella vexata]|uniref:Uncharacterized protein n=1 Tax=Pseudomassariella vexata TaxID=1141098 RepID=A0A1Y2D7G1_9PEZI|nr:uncharacterized protein BCR38DRAFT_147567 [Pseudomassariella vexata]ORY54545.1 hypothetical protein BCR38DRAFT_147567 [Pseudomassariella vexata]